MRRLLAIVLLACTALPGLAQTADPGVARGVRPDAAAEGGGCPGLAHDLCRDTLGDLGE